MAKRVLAVVGVNPSLPRRGPTSRTTSPMVRRLTSNSAARVSWDYKTQIVTGRRGTMPPPTNSSTQATVRRGHTPAARDAHLPGQRGQAGRQPPQRRRPATPGDPPLRQAGLPLRGRRSARSVCLLHRAGGRPGAVEVCAVWAGGGGAGGSGSGRTGRGGAGRDLGDQRRATRSAGAELADDRRRVQRRAERRAGRRRAGRSGDGAGQHDHVGVGVGAGRWR